MTQPASINTATLEPNVPTTTAATIPVQAAPTTMMPQGSVPYPAPSGTVPGAAPGETPRTAEESYGPGIEGETLIWEGRYSLRNFLGEALWRGILTLGWVGLMGYAVWLPGTDGWDVAAIGLGILLGVLWLQLFWMMAVAHWTYSYRLTNRRIFISMGILVRTRSQMELLRVKDIQVHQSLWQRWLSLGSVIIVPDDSEFLNLYLLGVSDPKAVMDILWHEARSERDRRSVRVDRV